MERDSIRSSTQRLNLRKWRRRCPGARRRKASRPDQGGQSDRRQGMSPRGGEVLQWTSRSFNLLQLGSNRSAGGDDALRPPRRGNGAAWVVNFGFCFGTWDSRPMFRPPHLGTPQRASNYFNLLQFSSNESRSARGSVVLALKEPLRLCRRSMTLFTLFYTHAPGLSCRLGQVGRFVRFFQ